MYRQTMFLDQTKLGISRHNQLWSRLARPWSRVSVLFWLFSKNIWNLETFSDGYPEMKALLVPLKVSSWRPNHQLPLITIWPVSFPRYRNKLDFYVMSFSSVKMIDFDFERPFFEDWSGSMGLSGNHMHPWMSIWSVQESSSQNRVYKRRLQR